MLPNHAYSLVYSCELQIMSFSFILNKLIKKSCQTQWVFQLRMCLYSPAVMLVALNETFFVNSLNQTKVLTLHLCTVTFVTIFQSHFAQLSYVLYVINAL